ncbi:SUR7/PalI family-domain-containing protein [Myxozyma melibiosi]|uniref:SUR7/PalI family-domain-containing protein n=1 Tax=Myxozyma melibiosi TaxID=54550 RepID=A0ABR1FEH2_9ASCO
MAIPRFLVTFFPFILTAGATLCLLLILLAGTKEHNPLNRVFYMETDTSSISGAPDTTRWTLWNICGVSGGVSVDCGSNKPAYAFEPAKNFGTSSDIPYDFINHRKTYYYLSRFSYAFYFIATGFTGFGFITGVLGLCSRLGAALTSFWLFLGLLTSIVAAALSTALFVKARNTFNDDGMESHMGVKLFAFAWTAVACNFISSIGFMLACCSGRKKNRGLGDLSDEPVPMNEKPRRGFFRRTPKESYPEDAVDHESQEPVMHQTSTTNGNMYSTSVPSENVANDHTVPEESSYVFSDRHHESYR